VCVGPGKNAAIGDSIAELIGGKIPLLCDDPEELVVRAHHKSLHVLPLLRRDRAGAIQHVLELAAFEYHRREADFIEKLLVV
jgi:hypothetical protein